MINLKLRFKNKATLLAIAAACTAFVYQILGLLGVVPSISQESVTNALGLIINILVALGIVVDPTTPGVSDSSASLRKDTPTSVEATLVNNMITDSLTSVDDAVADDNISQEAVDQIKRQTRTEE